MKKIVLTGGGTAGHVTPNLALLPSLIEQGFEVEYIGSYEGIEKSMAESKGIPYHGISSGKLRRYIDIKNISDPFRVVKGLRESFFLLRKLKPDIIFSKGGFVSVPVVLAAKMRKIPVIIHESDMTPGLANKIAFSGATYVCCNFPETLPLLPEGKGVVTGSPIRAELLSGNREKGLEYLGFNSDKPVLFITGGSLGSVFINEHIRDILDDLLEHFQVVHQCGKDNINHDLDNKVGYFQKETFKSSLPDIFAAADIVVSRAGANSICELLALKKPTLLIPLSKLASRGDQVLNADSFVKQGFSIKLEEEEIIASQNSRKLLFDTIMKLYGDKNILVEKMSEYTREDSVGKVMNLINKVLDEQSEKNKHNKSDDSVETDSSDSQNAE